MATVVVLGAGISAVTQTFELKPMLRKNDTLVVINDQDHFEFTPSNPWVAVGWRTPEQIQVELHGFFKKLRVFFAMIVPALILAATQAQGQPLPMVPLDTIAVVRQSLPLERLFDGTVEAVNQATVSAQTNARVAEVLYDVNDFVEAGQAIIRFTDVVQKAALQQAQAALTEAIARKSETEKDHQRVASLYQSGTVSKREYDRTLAAKDAAVARVVAAESGVKSAREQVDYTLVRAPYAGIVTQRHVEVGESVTVGQALLSGLSLEQLRVVVDVPQQLTKLLRESRSATIFTDEGRIASEKVTIFPFADAATNTFRIRLDLPIGQFGLYPGMFVKVAFVIGNADRLLIPNGALVRRSEVTAVYVVNDLSGVRLRQVRIGNSFADRVEVLAGLSEGEIVALDPVLAVLQVNSDMAQGNDR